MTFELVIKSQIRVGIGPSKKSSYLVKTIFAFIHAWYRPNMYSLSVEKMEKKQSRAGVGASSQGAL